MSKIDTNIKEKNEDILYNLRKKSITELVNYKEMKFNNNKEILCGNCIVKIRDVISYLKLDETFTLKNILVDIWDLLSDGVKRKIGKDFSKLVKKGKVHGVKVYKKKNNKTVYIKIA
ncbi:MAG: DUF1413 domain-containing protein [Clostridium sp.]|uniref:DUF1413 domain-containing protein n=1 Tax=Clostridium sp. TaxID=1506 RepID=UPI002903CD6C|nr:DUF1413 domain-containing protein [Clostridium sp.]MDU1230855.1 DUF1413 domain-containing protein [Clostridium sp.]